MASHVYTGSDGRLAHLLKLIRVFNEGKKGRPFSNQKVIREGVKNLLEADGELKHFISVNPEGEEMLSWVGV